MKKTIYQLTIEDVQSVAEQEFGRKLSHQEVELLEDKIANKIDWYEIISDSIDELFSSRNEVL